jgi:peptidoglycan/xylan/chitin deacetylase (PgdA/CDA1 family)
MRRWRVLCYHLVEPEHIRPFTAQLESFRSGGWEFAPFSQCLSERTHQRAFCWATVSFDDGDRSVCTVAQPVLDRLGIRAILYIATGAIEAGTTEAGRPAATWEDLARWLKAGHEIGSHTHHHLPMTGLSHSQQLDELETSRQTARRYLGVDLTHFAYPWGKHDRQTDDWFRAQSQWQSAATIERGSNGATTDPFQLRRDVLEPSWPWKQVRWRLATGSCAPLYRLYRSLRPVPTSPLPTGDRKA